MAQRSRDLPGILKPATVRQYCRQFFSLERMVANYITLYDELVAEGSLVGKTTTTVPLVA
jgi:hypothetical protein